MNWRLLVLFTLLVNLSYSQSNTYSGVFNSFHSREARANADSNSTSLWPCVFVDAPTFVKKDSSSWFTRKLLHESFFLVDEKDLQFRLDPVLDLSYWKDGTGGYLMNTRGYAGEGIIGNKVYVYSTFYENQAFLPGYMDQYAENIRVIPGAGRFKLFKTTGKDYAYASGYVRYVPNKYFGVQFGHGKNAYGYGHRSLLLSDNAFNYPYLRLEGRLMDGRLRYASIHASFQNLSRIPLALAAEGLFVRKGGSFNTVDFTINKYVEVGVFQGNIWGQGDSSHVATLPGLFYSPLIGTSHLISDARVERKWGMNWSIRPTDKIRLYGQLAQRQSTSYQVGAVAYDLLIPKLDVRVEYNKAGTEDNGFTHYNQPIGYTYGGDATEIVVDMNYRYRRIFAGVYASLSNRMMDSTGVALKDWNWGESGSVRFVEAKAGWVVNPSTSMVIEGGIVNRNVSMSGFSEQNNFIFVRFKTNLLNRYHDF